MDLPPNSNEGHMQICSKFANYECMKFTLLKSNPSQPVLVSISISKCKDELSLSLYLRYVVIVIV